MPVYRTLPISEDPIEYLSGKQFLLKEFLPSMDSFIYFNLIEFLILINRRRLFRP